MVRAHRLQSASLLRRGGGGGDGGGRREVGGRRGARGRRKNKGMLEYEEEDTLYEEEDACLIQGNVGEVAIRILFLIPFLVSF